VACREGEDGRVLASPAVRYRIVRQLSGQWHLYRDEQLIDVEHDPERSPLDEIFLWATRVVWAEDRLTVLGWSEVAHGAAEHADDVRRSDRSVGVRLRSGAC
jgi:hypothetical protein